MPNTVENLMNLTPLVATVGSDQMLRRTTIGVGDRISNKPRNRTYQATVVGTGTVSATVKIEGSNDMAAWLTLGTITISGTDAASDGFPSETAWTHVRANLTAIGGTGAQATVTMGSGSDA